MARYIVEFKQADNDGYIHTKRSFDELRLARAAAEGYISGNDFEYLVIRRVKDPKPAQPKKEIK